MTEARKEDANKVLDLLELPNYDDVEMRLAEPEMAEVKRINYLRNVLENADTRRRQMVAMKSNATKKIQ